MNVIIGDIHGHDSWKKIIEKEHNHNKIIFLGDYIDSFTVDTDTQYNNLLDILQLKEDNPDKIILLRGNHDCNSGLGYSWAQCSGYNPNMVTRFPKDRFLEDTQWIYEEDNIVYSHAGITQTWMNNVKVNSVSEINDLPPSEIFGFWSNSPYDVYGDSITQGPLWVRPQALASDAIQGYNQVVGHTCVKSGIQQLKRVVKGLNSIWLCDAMHVQQYLKIDKNNAEICRFED